MIVQNMIHSTTVKSNMYILRNKIVKSLLYE